jgi:hypothetical protein
MQINTKKKSRTKMSEISGTYGTMYEGDSLPYDGGSKHLLNGKHLPDHMVQQPRRQPPS